MPELGTYQNFQFYALLKKCRFLDLLAHRAGIPITGKNYTKTKWIGKTRGMWIDTEHYFLYSENLYVKIRKMTRARTVVLRGPACNTGAGEVTANSQN